MDLKNDAIRKVFGAVTPDAGGVEIPLGQEQQRPETPIPSEQYWDLSFMYEVMENTFGTGLCPMPEKFEHLVDLYQAAFLSNNKNQIIEALKNAKVPLPLDRGGPAWQIVYGITLNSPEYKQAEITTCLIREATGH